MLAIILYLFISHPIVRCTFPYFYYTIVLGILFYHISTIIHWVVYYQIKLLFNSNRTINRYYFEKDVKKNPYIYLLRKKQIINDIHPRYGYQYKVVCPSL